MKRLLLAALIAGCSATAGPDADTRAELGQPFSLRVGERAEVEEANLRVHFVEVAEDSRCPSNALILCVWEGDAGVVVVVTPVLDDTRPDTLHTTLEPKSVEIGAFLLELRLLEPYPADVTPIPVEEYMATFAMTRIP